MTSVAAHTFFLPELYEQYLQSLIAALTFLSNVFFWKTTNYFGSAAELKPLLHTWSLSLEEQYYLFAPLYVAAVYKWFNKNWYWALYPPLITSFLLSCFLMDKAASANYFMLPTRGWEILLGAVLAAAPPFKVRSLLLANLLSISGIALIAYTAFYFDKSTVFPGYSALLPCLGAAAIILAGSLIPARTYLVGKGLAFRPVVYVGLLSYSLYLVHWPVTVFFKYYRLAPLTLWDSLMVIGLSFLLALISYYLVERPFRKREWSRKAIFSASGAGIAGFVAFALTMQLMQVPTSLERSHAAANRQSDPCF
ncbi:O-antigen acetylase [Vibrio astriarenae]|nr:O-antigen acetylase [Vibrio sp. C7]